MSPEPARSEPTQAAYQHRAERLLLRFSMSSDGRIRDWRDDPMVFCRWFSELRTGLAPASWRQYRAAMVFFMERSGPAECVAYLRSIPQISGARRSKDRKSKAHRLSPEDLRRILDALSPATRRWDRLLGLWLVSGVLTGLRPCEWAGARMEGDLLWVRNAKATHGRAPGAVRRLDLSALADFERDSVRAMVEAVAAEPNFKAAYHACRVRLGRVVRRLWPRRKRRPSIYSARHQFRADAASAGRSAVEQAAMMGHVSTKTAEWHYGHRCDGSGRAPVGADPQCMAIIEHHEDRRSKRRNERRASSGGGSPKAPETGRQSGEGNG